MAYDIYGNNLRKGFCEVHPHVGEEYPCSLCCAEAKNQSRKKQEQVQYGRAEKDYYEAIEREHYEMLLKKDSPIYLLLCLWIEFLTKCLKKLESKREQMYQNKTK